MDAYKQIRDALIEDKLGRLAGMAGIAMPERLSPRLPDGEMYSLSGSRRPGLEGRIIVTRGLAESPAGNGGRGAGYELFIVSRDESLEWAVNLLAGLIEWELTENLDLAGRVKETGAVTIEQLPLRLDNPALNCALITQPWEGKRSAGGEVVLLAVTLIFEDEMRWALRYGREQLGELLKEAGIGLVSDQRRSSALTYSDLAEPLASLQTQGWFKKLNGSGITEYILDEVYDRYGDDWMSIALRVNDRLNARLLVERQSRQISVEWDGVSSAPLLEGKPISDLPEVVRDLAELMNIVAAEPGSLEDGVWEQVEMSVTRDEEGQLKVDWEFDYPEK
jgi:suppressor of fused protein SUFU